MTTITTCCSNTKLLAPNTFPYKMWHKQPFIPINENLSAVRLVELNWLPVGQLCNLVKIDSHYLEWVYSAATFTVIAIAFDAPVWKLYVICSTPIGSFSTACLCCNYPNCACFGAVLDARVHLFVVMLNFIWSALRLSKYSTIVGTLDQIHTQPVIYQ